MSVAIRVSNSGSFLNSSDFDKCSESSNVPCRSLPERSEGILPQSGSEAEAYSSYAGAPSAESQDLSGLEVSELVEIIESSLEVIEGELEVQAIQRPMIEKLSLETLVKYREHYQKQIDLYCHPHFVVQDGGFGDLKPRPLGSRMVYPKQILQDKVARLDKEITRRGKVSASSKK